MSNAHRSAVGAFFIHLRRAVPSFSGFCLWWQVHLSILRKKALSVAVFRDVEAFRGIHQVVGGYVKSGGDLGYLVG